MKSPPFLGYLINSLHLDAISGKMTEKSNSRDVEENSLKENRDQWTGKLDFVLSCLSFAVGLGNVWRFPFMCFKNGGAVFLIPYIIMLLFVGLPLFYMEICLGQFTGKGPIEIWEAVPMMKGIGYSMVANSFIMSVYYIVLVAYTLYYLFGSFAAELPWAKCILGAGTWATDKCFSTADVKYCNEMGENFTYFNGTCTNITMKITAAANSSKLLFSSPSEEYFSNEVLQLPEDKNHIGDISWQLTLCLLLAWIMIFLCMAKGSQSFGKVVYFTATFPYIVLTVLLIRGATLPGAAQGILFYIIPDFSRLSDPQVWFDAASQIFFSLGCGFGTLITFASFNNFKKKNLSDACIVAVGNCVTSLYAGFAIFGILGFMAADAGVDVKDVAKDGSGLAFIAYPQAVSRMPVSQLWSVLFFLMLLSLGVGTLFGPVEVVMTVIQDQWSFLRKYKVYLLAGLITVMFCIGLTMTTEIGLYIFTIFSDYNSYSIVIVGVLELVSISYIYGTRRFMKDVELMIDHKLSIYWRITWGITAPLLTFGVVICCFVLYKPSYYGHEPLPTWMNGIGWLIVVLSISPIPVFMIKEIYNKTSGWKSLLYPSEDWCPAHDDYKETYLQELNKIKENECYDTKDNYNTSMRL